MAIPGVGTSVPYTNNLHQSWLTTDKAQPLVAAPRCCRNAQLIKTVKDEVMSLILETSRMRLRPFRHDDLDELAAMFADEETMRYYPRPKTRNESQDWIAWNLRVYSEYGFGLWVMESTSTSEFLGDCGLTPQTVEGVTEIEVGWHTKRDFWNQGFATEAALACRDIAFKSFGLRRLISIIDPENLPSRRVAEKIGMLEERIAIHEDYPCAIYAIERS